MDIACTRGICIADKQIHISYNRRLICQIADIGGATVVGVFLVGSRKLDRPLLAVAETEEPLYKTLDLSQAAG